MSSDANPSALQDLQPESTFGPYRIARLLGRGGMGAVYEAEHHADGRIVALKLLSVDLDKLDSRERFLREGQTAAAINHPNAVYIYGTEEIDGTPAITMELVPGGTLEDKVKDKGPLAWQDAVEDILQVIDGLDAALAAGVLHRDVKPSNCFVGADGAVKIGDFGLSKPVDSEEQQKLTKTGLFLGTPVFSSPEQLLGESLDARSDIYAVGVTFYFLLTGQLPYQSGSMMQVVAAVLNGAPAPLAKYREGLPQPVIDVVMKSMARKVADRYQSYAEFRAAVAALRVEEVVPATLWDRFRASFVDWAINATLVWIFTWTLLRGTVMAMTANRAANWRQVAVSGLIALIIVGIPEGLRGASVGKWIIGIRVIGGDGKAPGIPRALARVLLLLSTDLVNLAFLSTVTDPNKVATALLLSTILLRSLFLVTARRANGWRLLHDVLTGTRVVQPRTATAQRRGEAQRATEPAMTGAEPRVGPYVVLGPLRPDSDIMRGWDGAMRRAVWIVPRPAGSSEATPARRTLSRLTRMRWVGGRRAPDDSWDAYEAPVGEPLTERLKRPVPWSVQQDWLQDVSNELMAAEQDGTTLTLHADAIWITPTDRVVFPEGGDASHASGGGQPIAVVAELLDRIASSSPPGSPLPRHAVRAIAAARTARSAPDVLSLVRGTLGRPVTVSRVRRGWLIAATIAPIAAITFMSGFTIRQVKNIDRPGYLMAGLLGFVADTVAPKRDSLADSVKRAPADSNSRFALDRIGLALRSLGVLPPKESKSTASPDSLREQRRLAEIYLATVLRDRARDTVTQGMLPITPKQERLKAHIIEKHKTVDSASARAARALVDSVWKGAVPGNGIESVQQILALLVAAFFVVIGAGLSIAAGLFARRGPLMRGFQLDLVTADGVPAGRLRILVRNLAIWFVVFAPIPVFLLAPRLSIGGVSTAIVLTATVTVLVWIGAVASSVYTPMRGLSERVSGTYLVPE